MPLNDKNQREQTHREIENDYLRRQKDSELMDAIREGNINQVINCLNEGADPNAYTQSYSIFSRITSGAAIATIIMTLNNALNENQDGGNSDIIFGLFYAGAIPRLSTDGQYPSTLLPDTIPQETRNHIKHLEDLEPDMIIGYINDNNLIPQQINETHEDLVEQPSSRCVMQ